eukprot:TRINITY_DN9951_c0_g2_i1.p1 TRINITY_DN9951_c0_g2~~TRINITY_DN9951_c0_g2_i1.p1  ORF type:complete len:470 (-),score=59.44 TRINITY_DN9951_c0_g2_i1:153-1562(-)
MSSSEARDVGLVEGPAPVPSFGLFIAVAVACVSPFVFGYALAFSSPAEAAMKGDFVSDKSTDGLSVMTSEQFEAYSSLVCIGAALGALSGSYLGDAHGRRNTLAFIAFPFFIAWGATSVFSRFFILLLLRILIGWAVGVGSAVTPIYINEISPPSVKGVLGAANQLSITTGTLMANVLGSYAFVVEDGESKVICQWRLLSLTIAIISAGLACAIFLPESPRWLAKNGRSAATIQSLGRLRKGDSLAEAHEMLAEANSGNQNEDSGRQVSLMSKLRQNRKGLIVGIGLCAFQQLSGINGVIFFVEAICKSAGMPNPKDKANLLMGLQVILTLFATYFMDSLGRRVYLIFGGLSMACGCFITAFSSTSTLQIAGLALFIVGFSFGLGPIPWLILGELFATDIRGTAASLATAVNWFASYAVTQAFEPLQQDLGLEVFAIFGTICCLGTAFVFFFVPETLKRPLDEILSELS